MKTLRTGGTSHVLSMTASGLILIGGYVHYELYRNGYRAVPKIGIGFLAQASLSVLLAAALLIGRSRIRLVARLGAVVLNLGTLSALAIAHTSGGLFNFRERGLRPAPETLITIVVESLAAALLLLAIVDQRRDRQDCVVTRVFPTANAAREDHAA